MLSWTRPSNNILRWTRKSSRTKLAFSTLLEIKSLESCLNNIIELDNLRPAIASSSLKELLKEYVENLRELYELLQSENGHGRISTIGTLFKLPKI